MNNLHRDLAPVSDAAWAELEAEARRTFCQHLAGRRAVDVSGPNGLDLAAVGTGHTSELAASADGVQLKRREALAVIELRVPFSVSRAAVDVVARGAKDADWQPVKEAAKKLAYAEDRAIVDGLTEAGISGVRGASTVAPVSLPDATSEYPVAVANAVSALRLAGVAGPYRLLLSAPLYTAVAETTEHGYPIHEHIARVLGEAGEIIWAPAIDAALMLSARGGDYELHLGEDASIGYLAHSADSIELYIEESLTFQVHSPEAAVALT